VINQYVGNLPPTPGVFPDYSAPVVRNVLPQIPSQRCHNYRGYRFRWNDLLIDMFIEMRPSPAVYKRRMSRIAKGPLARCSQLALARIAKGGGLGFLLSSGGHHNMPDENLRRF
jgi:hypothetical protein